MAGHSTYHVNVIKLLNNTGFTLRILVAEKGVTLQEKVFQKRLHICIRNSHRLLNISQRILHSKQRILQSPLPNERPDNRSVFFYHDKKMKN